LCAHRESVRGWSARPEQASGHPPAVTPCRTSSPELFGTRTGTDSRCSWPNAGECGRHRVSAVRHADGGRIGGRTRDGSYCLCTGRTGRARPRRRADQPGVVRHGAGGGRKPRSRRGTARPHDRRQRPQPAPTERGPGSDGRARGRLGEGARTTDSLARARETALAIDEELQRDEALLSVVDAVQQAAFQSYIQGGGGYVGAPSRARRRPARPRRRRGRVPGPRRTPGRPAAAAWPVRRSERATFVATASSHGRADSLTSTTFRRLRQASRNVAWVRSSAAVHESASREAVVVHRSRVPVEQPPEGVRATGRCLRPQLPVRRLEIGRHAHVVTTTGDSVAYGAELAERPSSPGRGRQTLDGHSASASPTNDPEQQSEAEAGISVWMRSVARLHAPSGLVNWWVPDRWMSGGFSLPRWTMTDWLTILLVRLVSVPRCGVLSNWRVGLVRVGR
jgi:hypothetical protein